MTGNAIVWGGGDTIHRAGIALECLGYESNIFSVFHYVLYKCFLIEERSILF